jgi:hypothetical protein
MDGPSAKLNSGTQSRTGLKLTTLVVQSTIMPAKATVNEASHGAVHRSTSWDRECSAN